MSTQQHKCPGCGAETMGYIKRAPICSCSECGGTFSMSNFDPKPEDETRAPNLEELLSLMKNELTDVVGFTSTDQALLIVGKVCEALADKVVWLEKQNKELKRRAGSMRRRISHLQSKGLRGSTG